MERVAGDLLKVPARRFGTKCAIVGSDRSLTFAELDRLSTHFAAGIAELGVRPGDRVMLWLENGWRWVVGYYGTLRAGGVVVPANCATTAAEARWMSQDCGVKAVLCRGGKWQPSNGPNEIAVISVDGSRDARGIAFQELLERGASALHRWSPPSATQGDLAAIYYTSGTTGTPKGVALRHESVVLNVAMTSLMHSMHAEDTMVTPLPCAHVYGNVMLNAAISSGMTLVLLSRLDERAILEAAERHRATILAGVPSMYLALLRVADIERFDLERLRLCTVGGQTMAVDRMIEVERRLGCRLIELWGMTEIAGLGATHPFNGPSNLGSIGIPLPFTEIRIADPDDPASEKAIGEIGELLVRGPHVMQGYFGQPLETDTAIEPDGWLHSGDLARRDERGYLYIVDRIKDVILSGGYTIYPAEIERIIAQHPLVLATCVVPASDELRGEIVKALVVLRPGAELSHEDVLVHCRSQLSTYKVPRAIEFKASLPTGCTGKVLRRAAR